MNIKILTLISLNGGAGHVDKPTGLEQFYFDLLNPQLNILKVAGNIKGYKPSP